MNVTDALGKEIIIGMTYGYSNSNSGWTRTVIGEAVSITEKGNVTLKVINSKSGCGSNLKEDKPGDFGNQKSKVSVRSTILFPIRFHAGC